MLSINDVEELIRRTVIEILEKDKEFRCAIAGAIGLQEILKRLDRHEEELKIFREDINKLREDMMVSFKRHDEILMEHAKRTKEFEVTISALGARWGVRSGRASRTGLKELIEKETNMKVERWVEEDTDGFVYGRPSSIEIDIVVKDGRVILVEIKSSVDLGDIFAFKRKAEFYEKKTNIKPSRLLMITPYVRRRAIKLAKNLESML